MKKAILIRMLAIAVAVLVLCACVSSIIMKRNYEDNLKQSIYNLLYTIDGVADTSIPKDTLAKEISQQSGYRATIISPDGTVLGDSFADYTTMENHSNRIEVQQALANGKADDIRYSQTQKAYEFYVAIKLKDNNILRISVPLEGIEYSFARQIPAILLGIILIMLASFLLAKRISGAALKPLNNVTKALKEIEENEFSKPVPQPIYEELLPLVNGVNSLVSHIKSTTETIEVEKNKLEFLLDSMRQGLIVADKDLKILHHNRSVAMLFNFQGNLNGKSLLNLTHNNKIISAVEKCLEQGNATVFNMEFPQTERIYSVSVNPTTAKWIENGVIIIFTDSTEQYKAEQMRSEFISNASHELKTPITSIKGFTELVLSDLVSEDQRKDYLERIKAETDRISMLIDDILSLSQIEENKIRNIVSPIDMLGCAKEVVNSLKSQAKEKQVELSVTGEAFIMQADKQDMQRLLKNLIENAIKYNKENGSVHVNIASKLNNCIITVTDDGIGIPAKDIPRIFERFYRVDKGRSQNISGTGLGLSIVKHIVAAYGGEINVKSTLGEGTVMEISIKSN